MKKVCQVLLTTYTTVKLQGLELKATSYIAREPFGLLDPFI
jgi:hypothetical protein